MNLEIFKAYDVRGVYPTEINEEAAYSIGKAYAEYVKPKKIAVGRDVRPSGEGLWDSLTRGLTEMGVDVLDLGIITTDMLYFAVEELGLDGGISVTGSHTPRQYNGIKFVKAGNIPISSDSGLFEIRDIAQKNEFSEVATKGKIEEYDILDQFVEKLLTFINRDEIKPFMVVVNPNFGAAGKVIEKIGQKLNLELVKLNFEQDGTFPKGRPDPLIPELRSETSELVRSSRADMGVAWDADADRVYWYDEEGEFIEGCYEGCILSQILLKKNPGSNIVHDPRLVWAAENIIKEAGGTPLMNKAGHTFIKERMRKEDAIFGFENSGHMFFKDYYYCDNGMIPWLLIMQEMSQTDKKLSEIIEPIRNRFPISDEVNFVVQDAEKVIKEIEEKYSHCNKDYTDGIILECDDYRINLRKSNTGEPLIRLNVEAKSQDVLDPKKAEVISIIKKDISVI